MHVWNVHVRERVLKVLLRERNIERRMHDPFSWLLLFYIIIPVRISGICFGSKQIYIPNPRLIHDLLHGLQQ